jgi:lipid II:glycine glycyltransferase (peptidoglycan interpeptide bridge formation enzyme)
MTTSTNHPDPHALKRLLEEDEAAWNAFVQCAPGGDLVQTSAWGRSKRAVGLGTRLVVVRDRAGAIVGGAQIILKRVAPGLAAGGVARGPLLRDASADAERVVDRVVSEARAAGVRFLILQPPEGGEAVEQVLEARGFETGCPSVAPEATIRLDLRQTDDELLAAMSKMRRRYLDKRHTGALEISAEDDVDLFQRLHAATAARRGFTALDVAPLRAQWDALAPSGRCVILIARHEGVPVSGAWLTSFAGVTTFRLAGWDADAGARAAASKHANEAVQWAAIGWARSFGAHTHDLGGFDRRAAETILAGGDLPEGFRRTPDHFKYGFGGSLVLFPVARWAVIGRGVGAVARPLVRRMLASDRARSAMGRVRNG